MIEDEYYEEDEAPRQPPFYLLTGLVIGLVLGLLLSLVIAPAQVVDTAPELLASADKDAYRLMIARAYHPGGDLPRARQRLNLLGDPDPAQALADQALRAQAEGGGENDIRALAQLAADLTAPGQPRQGEAGQSTNPTAGLPGESAAPAATPQTFATLDLAQAVQTATLPPTPTSPPPTPRPTFTPRVQPSPLPTLGAPFVLFERREVCDAPQQAGQNPPRLQIEVQDSTGKPVAGIAISVAWEGGIDTFFTGLHPQVNPGYADFDMQPGVIYSLRVGELSETLNGLSAPECTPESAAAFPGSLYLIFRQP